MQNLKNPAVMGKKILGLLEKDRILLLQDKVFPNIVTKIVGQSIAGSWWGHPLANPIYNGLQWLEDTPSVLVLKLISGKVTYLHESLFSDIYSIVVEPRDWQLKKLNEEDLKLLKYLSKKEKVSAEDRNVIELVKDPKKSFVKLEKKLLVHSEEVHTATGKHVKEFRVWKNSKISKSAPGDFLAAMKKIENLVDELSRPSGAKVKLPWL
jgi:hypothetical protein